MRLLVVSHSLPPLDAPLANVGGIQRVAVELHDALAAHPGVRLESLALRAAWRERHVAVPRFLARAIPAIARRVRAGEVDAVLFASMVTGALAVPLRRTLAAHGVRTGVIAYGHDVIMRLPPYQWLVRRVFRAVDVALPISAATGAACLARGLPPERMAVVPLAVDAGRFPPPGDRAAERRALRAALGGALPVPDDAFLLCGVGRHVRRKGFDWFAREVMPRLPAHVHWALAGEGPETPRIRESVRRLGLGARVHLLGRLPDERITMLYRGADLFVMPNVPVPSDMEGFGLVMLEAGLCGLPSVASRLEGITDAITEGENGLLVEPGDAGAFADAVHRLAGDRAALAALSARARRHTAETFRWSRTAERYVAALAGAAPGASPVPVAARGVATAPMR